MVVEGGGYLLAGSEGKVTGMLCGVTSAFTYAALLRCAPGVHAQGGNAREEPVMHLAPVVGIALCIIRAFVT